MHVAGLWKLKHPYEDEGLVMGDAKCVNHDDCIIRVRLSLLSLPGNWMESHTSAPVQSPEEAVHSDATSMFSWTEEWNSQRQERQAEAATSHLIQSQYLKVR